MTPRRRLRRRTPSHYSGLRHSRRILRHSQIGCDFSVTWTGWVVRRQALQVIEFSMVITGPKRLTNQGSGVRRAAPQAPRRERRRVAATVPTEGTDERAKPASDLSRRASVFSDLRFSCSAFPRVLFAMTADPATIATIVSSMSTTALGENKCCLRIGLHAERWSVHK